MEFKLPDIGEGVHEGEVTKWLVKPGDPIQADQPMVEVMTDKATVEIPSPVTGVVDQLMAKEGQTIEVGKVLLTITEKGAAGASAAGPQRPAPAPAAAPKQAAPAPKAAAPAPTPKPAARPATQETAERPKTEPQAEAIPFNVLATPATRKLARDLNVDLKSLQGTGPAGRVTKDDVSMAYEGGQAASSRSSHPAPASTAVATRGATAPATTAKPAVHVQRGATQRIPLKGVRKKIAEAMSHSKHTAAHFTYVEEVDLTELVKLRASAKEEAASRGVKLTYLPFIIKALIPALTEFPFLNASLDDEAQEIVLKGDYNIGIATDTPQGLMVPVVKNVDRKTIWEISAEISALAEKARTGKIALDDLRGGTFTLTNAGTIGGVFTAPVINHPEVAILGVNSIRKRPMVVADKIEIRDMMYLSMSVDHRVVDGADAARFMNRVVYFLSDPRRLVFA